MVALATTVCNLRCTSRADAVGSEEGRGATGLNGRRLAGARHRRPPPAHVGGPLAEKRRRVEVARER